MFAYAWEQASVAAAMAVLGVDKTITYQQHLPTRSRIPYFNATRRQSIYKTYIQSPPAATLQYAAAMGSLTWTTCGVNVPKYFAFIVAVAAAVLLLPEFNCIGGNEARWQVNTIEVSNRSSRQAKCGSCSKHWLLAAGCWC